MDVALIPPVSLLGDTARTDMQLLLPQMWYNRVYMIEYSHMLRDPKQYVIMDNGAAEDERLSDEALVRFAAQYEPNEMAIPDHLGDMANTVAHARQFLDQYGMRLHEDHRIKLGYVAQGSDPEEAFYGVQKMVYDYGWLIDTIFIPRLLVKNTNLTARLQLALDIHNTWKKRFDIHFFGASNKWPGEVIEAANTGFIRSIDTSWPYQAAFHKVPMRRSTRGHIVTRPQWYFARNSAEFSNPDIYVERYLKWANHPGSTRTPSAKNAR